MTDRSTCQDCRFWDRRLDSKEGYCRRYAPRPSLPQTSWPITLEAQWCGEIIPRVDKIDDTYWRKEDSGRAIPIEGKIS